MISIGAVAIALSQYFIAKHKLRLDLYNRRFRIYELTNAVYQNLSGTKESLDSPEHQILMREFIRSIRESQFLFKKSSKIYPILEAILEDAFKVSGFKDIARDLSSDPQTYIAEFNTSQSTYLNLNNKILELENALTPYLNFQKL